MECKPPVHHSAPGVDPRHRKSRQTDKTVAGLAGPDSVEVADAVGVGEREAVGEPVSVAVGVKLPVNVAVGDRDSVALSVAVVVIVGVSVVVCVPLGVVVGLGVADWESEGLWVADGVTVVVLVVEMEPVALGTGPRDILSEPQETTQKKDERHKLRKLEFNPGMSILHNIFGKC